MFLLIKTLICCTGLYQFCSCLFPFVICRYGFIIIGSPKSCLSWLSSSEKNYFVGPPNPCFSFYAYVPPSPTISVETDPNWRRELNSKHEDIQGMFDLQLALPAIDNVF